MPTDVNEARKATLIQRLDEAAAKSHSTLLAIEFAKSSVEADLNPGKLVAALRGHAKELVRIADTCLVCLADIDENSFTSECPKR